MSQHRFAKGNIYIAIGLGVFYLSGYVIHFALARLITPQQYGTVGVILAILTISQLFFMKGIPTAASKYLSQGANGREVVKKSIIIQTIFTIILSVILYFAAPFIADLLGSKDYSSYIRFLIIILFIRSYNELYRNYFNGYRQFKKQTTNLIVESLPKIIFVLIFVYLGFEIYGIIAGYAAGSLLALIYGIIIFRPNPTEEHIRYSQIITFSYPLIIYSIIFQLITSLDLFFIKSFQLPDYMVGYYTSARVITTVFVFVGMTFSITLLPSLSKSYSERNLESTNRIILSSLRLIFILFLPAAVIISINSKELLSFLFTSEYSRASAALSILIWGWLFLQFFNVLAAMINAAGNAKAPALISFLSLILCVGANYYLIPKYGMEGGAWATTLSGLLCFTFGIIWVKKLFLIKLGFKYIYKILFASAFILLISYYLKFNGILCIAWCIILFAIYFGILIIIKEIKKSDVILFKDILSRYEATAK